MSHVNSEQSTSKGKPSGSGSARSSNPRGRRPRSRRTRSAGQRNGNQSSTGSGRRDYLPSDEALAAEEASVVEDANAERVYVQELKIQADAGSHTVGS